MDIGITVLIMAIVWGRCMRRTSSGSVHIHRLSNGTLALWNVCSHSTGRRSSWGVTVFVRHPWSSAVSRIRRWSWRVSSSITVRRHITSLRGVAWRRPASWSHHPWGRRSTSTATTKPWRSSGARTRRTAIRASTTVSASHRRVSASSTAAIPHVASSLRP